MLFRRLTILCLMIAGCAAVASIFIDRKYDVYHDQPVVGPGWGQSEGLGGGPGWGAGPHRKA